MRRLLNLLPWRRSRLERDLDRELRYHMDRRIEDLRRSGLTDAEARRRAAIEFGGVPQVQETVRDTWVWQWLDTLSRDIRYATRMLVRTPSFTFTTLVSLAIGIGANAALFSLVDQVLLRTLEVREPNRLTQLIWRGTPLTTGWGSGFLMSYPLCRELDQQRQFFEGVLCRHRATVNFSTGQQHEPVPAEIVTGSYFEVLGIQPVPGHGRLIAPSDDLEPGAHPVVVLSHGYWKTALGSAPDIVGRKVLLDNYPMTVIGIAPRGFTGVDPHAPAAVWIPASMTVQAANIDAYWDRLMDRRAAWLNAIARLKPGVTIESAKAGVQPWFKSMLETDSRSEGFPSVTAEQRKTFLDSSLDVVDASRGLSNLRGGLERPLWVLMTGTALLLLLASLNVAGLLLARGAARTREFSTRMAIGATRGRITSQLLVEGLFITAAGGWIGLLAAPIIARLLLLVLSDNSTLTADVDVRLLTFAGVVTVASGLVCALVPAWQTGRLPLVASLNERTRTPGGVRLRKLLVVGQMAFTLVLLVGAGLFVQTLARLHQNVGFAGNDLLMVSIDPPGKGYSAADGERVMRAVLQKLRDLPIVERATVANSTLLTGGASTTSLTLATPDRVVLNRGISRMRVGPGFFATLGAPIVEGRDFDEREVRPAGAKPRPYQSVIVNESFAKRNFGGRSPIGHRIGLGNRPDVAATIEIIGVVKDFSRRTLRDAAYEQFFVQFWDNNSSDGTFYVRVRGSAESAMATIRSAVGEIDATLPVTLRVFEEQVERSLRTERMLATLSTAFGVIALLLSVVGLYGVMSFVVTQRRPEIGIRLALGATRSSAVRLIVRDAAMMIAAGTLVALPSAWALRTLVEAQLFGIEPFDGLTLALASGVLALVALGAAMLPAWRAASISPTEALRAD